MTGAQVLKVRKNLHLSQPQLAQIVGVTKLSISRWERNVHPVPPFYVALFRAFRRAHQERPRDLWPLEHLVKRDAIEALSFLLGLAYSPEHRAAV